MKQSLSAIHTLQILCGNLPCRRHANKLSDMSANLDSHPTCNRLSRLNWFGFNRWFEVLEIPVWGNGRVHLLSGVEQPLWYLWCTKLLISTNLWTKCLEV
jgi:hypothetical protein